MDIAIQFGYVLLGVIGLYWGAEWLVEGSTDVAFRFGVSPLVIGLTVIAFGTSSPELIVCINLNLSVNAEMAVDHGDTLIGTPPRVRAGHGPRHVVVAGGQRVAISRQIDREGAGYVRYGIGYHRPLTDGGTRAAFVVEEPALRHR